MSNQGSLLRVARVKKHYKLSSFFKKTEVVKAVDGISFELGKKETLAIVGESGCGKSTLAKLLMGIEKLDEGEIKVADQDLNRVPNAQRQHLMQMIFQDPYSSLNPRKRIWQVIGAPLFIHSRLKTKQIQEQVQKVMSQVGLRPEYMFRFPHMFSGGQRQRVGIARALMLHPKIMICDEPVSALDISVQAQVLNLLMDLQDQFGLSYIFISHDLSVVKHIANRVLVMYLGRVVEQGSRDQIFYQPQHPYTRALLSSALDLHDPHQVSFEKVLATGEMPSPLNPPSGCSFHPRCPFAQDKCKTHTPESQMSVDRHEVACHFPLSRE